MFGVFLFLSLFLFRSHILHRWLIEDKHSDSGVDLPADPIVSVEVGANKQNCASTQPKPRQCA